MLSNAFTILNGGELSLAQAQTGVASASNAVLDSLKKNKTAITGHTAAALANQQAIQSQVAAAQQEAEAVGKATGSSKAAVKAYKDSEDGLLAQMRAAHLLTPALKDYIEKLYDVKNLHIPPTKLDLETAGAEAKLKAWEAAIRSNLSHVTVHIGVDGQASFSVQGSRIEFHAGGGTAGGIGSSTSDSNIVALSKGEEVIRESRARGYNPMLKAINNGSQQDIQRQAAALAGGRSGSTVNKHMEVHLTTVNPVAVDPVQSARKQAQRALDILQAGGF